MRNKISTAGMLWSLWTAWVLFTLLPIGLFLTKPVIYDDFLAGVAWIIGEVFLTVIVYASILEGVNDD